MLNNIAIAVFAYKRPEKLEQLVKSMLSEMNIDQFSIYVFIDGAKSSEDKSLTAKCFDVVRENFPPNTNVVMRDRNLGSRNSIIEGLDEVFRSHKQCIILEDDLIVLPGFQDFVLAALALYESDSSILGISAHQPLNLILKPGANISENLFGYRPQSWGWATWADRWSSIDWKDEFILNQLSHRKTRQALARMGFDVIPMVRSMIQKTIDAWDVALCVHAATHNSRFIYPRKTFTTNDGFGEGATHTTQIEYPKFKVLRILEFGLLKIKFRTFAQYCFHAMILKHYST